MRAMSGIVAALMLAAGGTGVAYAASPQEKAVSTLTDLVETLRDGQEGFQTAADGIKDAELKRVFQRYADQRRQFIADLQDEIQRRGGKMEPEGGSLAGVAHRGWINMKSAVMDEKPAAVLSEATRGEQTAVKNYEKALQNEELPADLRAKLERQHRAIQEAYNDVRMRRDRAEAQAESRG